MMEHERVLVIDVGNTRSKAALYGGGGVPRLGTFRSGDVRALNEFLGGTTPAYVAIGAVAHVDGFFLDQLQDLAPLERIQGDSAAPLVNEYGTPATLGVDRLANAVAAAGMFPGRHVLAIDAGTCITYDLVDASGIYMGGAISPGLRLRARAMYEHGAHLPLVEPDPEIPGVGGDTTGSLQAGIFHGTIAEMRGMIVNYAHHRPDMAVIITGGDAPACTRGLKSGIFAHPYLTLEGLYAISLHIRGDRAAAAPDGAGAGTAG
jgi:type III pantothenate kinase